MKSKIKPNIKTIAIVSVVLFSLIVPQIAKADILADILGAIGKDILITLGQAIHHILNWLLKAAAAVFDGVLDIGFNNDIIRVAKIGWGVTRDFSNMFFILFLVIVAFATILRLPQYGIRELLPKVIIIALLINFSFVIVAVIIDFSNIAAEFFIKDIRDKIGPEGEGIFGATFADSLGTTGIFITFANCEEFLKYKEKECQRIDNLIKNAVGQAMPFIGPLWDPSKCMKRAGELYGKCQKYGLITVPVPNIKSDVSFLNIFLSMTVGSIILLIAAFTLFAGAILLLIRIIALWLLIVIVPFVFICYIMPGLQGMWRKWWSAFLSWAFFAPAYAFFVWMAILIATAGINQAIGNIIQNPIGGDYGAFANPFLADPGAQLVGYGIIIAFLLGGLIMARQIGIYGAGAALNIAQKAGRGAKTWAARTTMRPVRGAATAVGAGALTAGGALFGGKVGRRMKARAAQLREAAAERPEHKKYRAMAERMANADLLKEVETAKGPRKLIATRIAERRGILREAERDTVREAGKALRAFGATEEARRLEEFRPDAIEDATERKAAEERAYKEGIHKRWSGKVFEGVEGARVVEETREQLGTGEFVKVFKGWAKDVRDKAEEALRAGFTDNFTDTKNIERRKAHAAATGKAHQALFGDQAGIIQARYRTDPNAQKQARTYIQTLKDEDFGNLKEDEDRALAAMYMTPSQVYGAGMKLSGRHKNQMRRIAQRVNAQAYKRMQRTDTWAT